MQKDFLDAIHSGKYHQAKSIIGNMSPKDLSQFLVSLSFDTGSINIYTFVCFLLLECESTALHYCAAGILSHGLCMTEGAYSAALFHARRAAELSPDNLSSQVELLFFFGMPDQIMSATEAKKIAQKILLKDPTNNKALEVIETIKKHELF